MSRSLHVAIVVSELPYPPNGGNRIRTLNLASSVARKHKITFFAHRNNEAEEATRYLKGFERRKVACILKPPHQEFQEQRRCDPNPR